MGKNGHTGKYVSGKKDFAKKVRHCWQLYVLLAPTVVYLLIFCYLPMLGIQIAFRDYTAVGGIWGSAWVGWKHFLRFFSSPQFNHCRNKVGCIGQALYYLLEPPESAFIYEQRQDDRKRESPNQGVNAYFQGIYDKHFKLGGGKKSQKMFPSYPCASPDAADWFWSV